MSQHMSQEMSKHMSTHRMTRAPRRLAALGAIMALALVVGAVGTAGSAQAGAAESTRKAGEGEAAKAPELLVVRFYADWCGYCEQLDAELDETRDELAEKPVLFLQLDLTDEQTRPQAELLASLLGIDEAWAEHNQRTGFALLVEPGSGDVVGQLTAGQDADELHEILTGHLTG